VDWVNALTQGLLLGGLYALFAAGLSLVFGIMRVVNLAHGDFIILAAFLSIVVVGVTGVGPFLSLVIVVRPAAPARHVRSLRHHPEPAPSDLLGGRSASGCG